MSAPRPPEQDLDDSPVVLGCGILALGLAVVIAAVALAVCA